MKTLKRMRQALALSMILLAAWLLPLFCFNGITALTVDAISTDYPMQLMNIAVKDNSKVLTENGTSDGSSLSVKALGNDLSPSWRFDMVGTDSKGTFFKLCNAESGRLLTPNGYSVKSGTSVIMYGSESHQSQHWYIIPVENDRLGNGLYYKIVNYSDTNLALTQDTSGMILSAYTGADNQLWLLNSDGLQGFAGYCFDDNTGSIKAGNIGGLFGEVVEASTFDELKKYATSDTPYTIVVTKDISVTNLTMDSQNHYYCPDGRIYVHSNKTIIGSYGAHTMRNVQFCTSSKNGVGNNVIIKNFDLQHDEKSNGNDSIVVYFGSGENLWVDHVTFTGHSAVNTQGEDVPDWDKFLACCYDADYCTVSDSSFGLHEYGVILGYPADDENSYNNYNNFPRMSIIGNQFTNTITRGPGLMRYGYFHSLNNYVNTFSMAYTVHTACKIFAENCYYDGGSINGNVICDWNTVTYPGSYAETGSEFVNCKRTTIEGYAQNCTWRPTSNYSYVSLTAAQAKNYCSSYSGCQTSNGNMMYLRFGSKGVPSAGFNTAPSEPFTPDEPSAASFSEGAAYRIKNVNSGLYMQVENASAENNANVHQWGSDGKSVHDIWKFYSAGDGYYYISSCVGDGGTYVLDVAAKKSDNGTNIDIYQYNGGNNQQFMLTMNSDNSYKILTKISDNNSAIEVSGADKSSGANIQQWEVNGASCQDWILEPVSNPGTKMDTSVVYTFENVNSGLVMDIVNGKMENDSNIQQWTSNGLDCQKWILKEFGSDNYYWICSLNDENYAMQAESSENGGNISISEYSADNSSQLFRFTKNIDGSYSIITHASQDTRLVETAYASKDGGANIQQWETTNSECQKWKLITEAMPVPEKIIGDIDNDGELTVKDLTMLKKYLLDISEDIDTEAADINNNGNIDVFDLCIIKNMILAKA
ncbi:MAG: RICIN domain-containing protein [Oscillospiraceae bacterium]